MHREMAREAEDGRPQSAGEASDTSEDVINVENPGIQYLHYIAMEKLFLKLIRLKYVTCVKEFALRQIHKHYFAVQTNPGEQFHQFTNLAAWLIRKCGKPFEQPQEYDDPNSTIAAILDAVRQIGGAVDFSPNKLKQGYGEHVIYVLTKLADAALKFTKFEQKRPVYPKEDETPVEYIDDDSEIIEEIKMQPAIDEDDPEADVDAEQEGNVLPVDEITNQNVDVKRLLPILESEVIIEEWKLELERVLPQLKVTITSDNRDWRSRLEQMISHRKGIEDALSTTRVQLDKLQEEITQVLDKINNREKYLNSQLEAVLAQYHDVEDEFSRISEKHRVASAGVSERSHTLAGITEELEAVKQEMEERGSSMTDGTPLVNVKKAITKLKNEVINMDIRIGVLEHSLMQARLRDKSQLQQDMNTPSV
ncbi:intraflagellar transport protein 57 homolog isoform X2 [Anabrus simplex]